MDRWNRWWKRLVLSAGISVLALSGGTAGNVPGTADRGDFTARLSPDPILLSLRLAQARKDGRSVSFYQSVARQRRAKGRRASGHGRHLPENRRFTSGRTPPSAR